MTFNITSLVSVVSVTCSLLSADVAMNSEQLLRRKFSPGDIINGVVEQVWKISLNTPQQLLATKSTYCLLLQRFRRMVFTSFSLQEQRVLCL